MRRDRYIGYGLLSNKPLRENQHAYQTGRSTETVLSIAVFLLEVQVGVEGFATRTLIDIQRAFNNTTEATIEGALRNYMDFRSVNHMLAGPTVTAHEGATQLMAR